MEDLGDEDAKAVEKGALRRSELLFQLTRLRYATENELGGILSFRTAGRRFGFANRSPYIYRR